MTTVSPVPGKYAFSGSRQMLSRIKNYRNRMKDVHIGQYKFSTLLKFSKLFNACKVVSTFPY